jgi:hypothetical protein
MFGLKPSKWYAEYWSEDKELFKTKKGYWTLREYYQINHYLDLTYWKYDFEDEDNPLRALWEKQIHIPLCWDAFYIQFIYTHLGKCHPDIRSKFYIGKGRKVNNK